MRGTPSETCRSATAAVRQLSRLARLTGYPPSRNDELVKLVSEVEAAAKYIFKPEGSVTGHLLVKQGL